MVYDQHVKRPSQNKVILLRGAPGVGKSTAALASLRLHGFGATCEVDSFRRMFMNVDWQNRAQHTLALNAAIQTAIVFAHGVQSPVLLIDCFSRRTASTTVQTLSEAGINVSVISLYARPEILQARLQNREGNYSNLELSILMNHEIYTQRIQDLFIDTSSLSSHEVAIKIAQYLSSELTS